MNRRQRRASRMRNATPATGALVPVFGFDGRVIELADPSRVRQLAAAENATVVRRRRDNRVERIHLLGVSDDSRLVKHRGNPRRYSHDHETVANPPRVWTIRRLGSDDPEAEQFVQRIFRSSVLDNLKQAS